MNQLINLIRNYPDQLNVIVAAIALFVSLLSVGLTVFTVLLQRRHNFKSLTPIANFFFSDYENRIAVALRNTGVGPLIVKKFTASDGKCEKSDILSWMQKPPDEMCWSDFHSDFYNLCISPNQEVIIIELEGDENDQKFSSFRDEVRRCLSELTLTVEYRDIYNREMPLAKRNLKWFSRNLI